MGSVLGYPVAAGGFGELLGLRFPAGAHSFGNLHGSRVWVLLPQKSTNDGVLIRVSGFNNPEHYLFSPNFGAGF